MNSSNGRFSRASASGSPEPESDDDAIHCVNPGFNRAAEAQLDMVHRSRVTDTSTLDAQGQRIFRLGDPFWQTNKRHIFKPDDPYYALGGTVQNVLTFRDDGGPELRTLIVCDPTTCDECAPDPNNIGPPLSSGLPFVHCRHVHAVGNSLTFRVIGNVRAPEMSIGQGTTAFEKKLIFFERPVFRPRVPGELPITYNRRRVLAAVCILTSCSSCQIPNSNATPSPSPSPIPSPSPTRSNANVSMRSGSSGDISMRSGTSTPSRSGSSRASSSPGFQQVGFSIANEDKDMDSTGRLQMIHISDIEPNVNDSNELVEGQPRHRGHISSRIWGSGMDEAYDRGGAVVNVSLRDGPEETIVSMMACDLQTCPTCSGSQAISGLGLSHGLPFVHASELHRNPPPNAYPLMGPIPEGIPFFREGSIAIEDREMSNFFEKRLVNFENPIGRGGIVCVETVVCVREQCPSCRDISESGSDIGGSSDISMEEPAHGWERPGPNENGSYDIERIVDSRRVGRSFEYRYRWVGYPPDEDTWTPIDEVLDFPEMIQSFHEDNPASVRPSLTLATRHDIEDLLNRP